MTRQIPLTHTAITAFLACAVVVVAASVTVNASEIHVLSMFGDAGRVEVLLRADPSLASEKDADSLTALHHAAATGHPNVVRVLLAHGANPRVAANDGVTPLHMAASWRARTPIRNVGASVSGTEEDYRDVAEQLIAAGVSPNTLTDTGSTALHFAAISGHETVAAVLLGHGADARARDRFGVTPLHRAAEYGNARVATLLLAHAADVDAVNVHRSTPLKVAASYGHRTVVELFLDKAADPTIKDSDGFTPFHAAVDHGFSEVVDVLLALRPSLKSLINTPVNDRRTPLHLAAWAPFRTPLLPSEFGRKPSATLRPDYTVVIQSLLRLGADVHAKDERGRPPLSVAVKANNLDAVKALLAYGADPNAREDNTETPLHYVAGSGAIVDALVAHGGDPNAATRDRVTPLHVAAFGGHTEVVARLLAHGAAINARAVNGRTALSLARYGGHLAVAEFLHKNGGID